MYRCADMFDVRVLGHDYDRLPSAPPRQLRRLPTLAVFEEVDILKMNKKSYMIHCFVVPESEAAAFAFPDLDEIFDSPHYAGNGAIFGGKGSECENCRQRDAFHVTVDISACLARQELSRHAAALRCLAVDEEGEIFRRLSFFVSPNLS